MKFGEFFFKFRSYTPIPIAIAMFAIPYQYGLWHPEKGNIGQILAVALPGLAILILGEVIRFISLAYSSPSTRTREVGAKNLFCSGPYAYVRNPLYIGNFFIMTGALIMAWTWFPWLLGIGIGFFIFQYYFIIRLEEETLAGVLGDEYTEYKKNVPRIIPGFTPFKGRTKEPDYRMAFKSETQSILAEVIMIICICIRWYIYIR